MTKPTRALARGLKVIQVLNERHSTPIGLLSERTRLSRATLLRILKTLDTVGWIYRYRTDGHYRLSSGICHLGQHLLTVDRLVECAAPVMDRLYEAVGWPSDIAVCTGHDMQLLESSRAAHPEISHRYPLNSHVPMLWSALGRVYLAFCPAAEREAILDKLRDSGERLDQAVHAQRWLIDLLDDTRARGYGITEPEWGGSPSNGEQGLGAMAVPVLTDGRIRACLSLIWIKDEDCQCRMVGEQLPSLLDAAQKIANSLLQQEMADAL